MKQMMKIGLLMMVCSLVMACGDGQVEQWLTRAERCMEAHSDSAYWYLLRLENRADMSDEQRARYALLRTQAIHKCCIPLESDSLINVAVEYYANSDDRHRLALSLLYKGLVHKENHQVEQAVEAFVGSEQAFEGVEDDQYKALLYNHYASLLMRQNMFDESLTLYKKTLLFELKGDSAHYVISTYGQIANLFELLGITDSAKAYYECGLSYADNTEMKNKINYFLLLQNYAMFLIGKDEYAESEQPLTECLEKMTDSNYLHTLYSALTTLYYEKQEYNTALSYGRRILGSNDSLTVFGGYLRLYKIYRKLGEMDSAFHYHNLYRQYDSDITLRRQTAKVAAIPNRMKNVQLVAENRNLAGWKLWLLVSLTGVVAVSIVIYVCIRRRHRFEQVEKERELTESQTSLLETKTSLTDTQNLLTKTKVDLGQMKGVLTHQANAFNRVKHSLEEMKKKHQEEIKQLKESVKKLEEDIQELKANDRSRNQTESELKQNVKTLGKQLKVQTDKLQHVEHQWEIDQRIEYFMASGMESVSVAMDLLLQLRMNKKGKFRYDIRATEHLPLLKALLEQENPALHRKLDDCGLEWKKLTMCYLIALGLDDVDMMACAACLAPNSVKVYRKECRELVETLQ